ncbi:DUF2303 family protein [Luteibacter yeojuensis]|uniref:DUF2303 family protein n=1 Tax=Luteibacter yeojuensis TaxID=345309 RepID=A0A7X5QT96_9GAMM|nr:DUF2303 family protein [Luteibacter yeojuensis]NID15010.1 DUF2303 family protein [Luteibacter yeojuensis]
MDSSALKLIQLTAIEAEKANRLDTHIPAVLHEGGILSLESLQEGRSRFRGKYTTDSIEAFVSYVQAHPGGEGFVNTENVSAKVYFNIGTTDAPGHADWTGELKLKHTPEFSALLQVNGRKLTQRDLVDFIEDWGHCITPFDKDGQPIKPSVALGAIRNISIKASNESNHQERDFGARRSAVEDIEASAENGVPYSFGFVAIPYPGLMQRSFTMRLSILTSGEKPLLVLRIISIESAVEAIAQEFKRTLEAQVGDAATLVLGNFSP